MKFHIIYKLIIMNSALVIISACSPVNEATKPEKQTNVHKVEVNLDDYIPEPVFEVNPHRNQGTIIERFPPMMPEHATKSGRCNFIASVDADGNVSKVYNLKCTDDVFLETTKKAALKWKFQTKTIEGRAIPFEAESLKLIYRLLDEDGNIIPE